MKAELNRIRTPLNLKSYERKGLRSEVRKPNNLYKAFFRKILCKIKLTKKIAEAAPHEIWILSLMRIYSMYGIWDIYGQLNRSEGRDFREKRIVFSRFLTIYITLWTKTKNVWPYHRNRLAIICNQTYFQSIHLYPKAEHTLSGLVEWWSDFFSSLQMDAPHLGYILEKMWCVIMKAKDR